MLFRFRSSCLILGTGNSFLISHLYLEYLAKFEGFLWIRVRDQTVIKPRDRYWLSSWNVSLRNIKIDCLIDVFN